MRIGTKSILYGAHAFWLHPWFVALAWWRLYGFPWDYRLWIAFFVHDLGYVGMRNMDDAEGETHPEFGARIMRRFGPEWEELVLCHSRYYAKRIGKPQSRLCRADKYAICLTPWWLYLPLVYLTGELKEYREAFKYLDRLPLTPREWYASMQDDMHRWVFDCKIDGDGLDGRFVVQGGKEGHEYFVLSYSDEAAQYSILTYAYHIRNTNPILMGDLVKKVRAASGLSPREFNSKFGDFLCKLSKSH